MRTTVRLLTGSALVVAAAGLVCAPAHAGDADGLDVVPSSVVPGGQVTVNTAACGEDGAGAGDASAVGAGTFTPAHTEIEGDPYRNGGSVNIDNTAAPAPPVYYAVPSFSGSAGAIQTCPRGTQGSMRSRVRSSCIGAAAAHAQAAPQALIAAT